MHWCILYIFEALMCILYIENTNAYYIWKITDAYFTLCILMSCNGYKNNNGNGNGIVEGNYVVIFRSIDAFATFVCASM
jgi:hypothetical protein